MRKLSESPDAEILREIGGRLARARIARELTQADIALRAGVSKRTVERIESGASTQTANWVRLMRALGLLDALDAAIPAGRLSPLALIGGKRERKRVRAQQSAPSEPWTWGDDE